MDSKTENLLKKLECKECGNYMCPPIRMCINRHSYCDLCFKKVTRCPECRGQKSTLRNHTFENIVHQMLFPCKYVDKGCGFLGNWNEIASHKDCDYGAKPCPFAIVSAMPCNWKGNRLELKGHMEVCQFSRYCSDAVPYRSLTRNSRQCYGRRLIMVYDQFFVVCWCKTGDFLKFFVYTMFGNVCAPYRFDIAFHNNDKVLFSFSSVCKKFDNYHKKSVDDKHCILMPANMMDMRSASKIVEVSVDITKL
ncbi:uncharacterized protein LOC109601589 [Aethina tumida]|uniref:uncharacterized protein LOC109601589 n=1 Tax=Aethina tumida TaxID=116153 RepID=UPI0021493EE7|nr:uncharacterized protein LOC109601589 [Aethina tumida]